MAPHDLTAWGSQRRDPVPTASESRSWLVHGVRYGGVQGRSPTVGCWVLVKGDSSLFPATSAEGVSTSQLSWHRSQQVQTTTWKTRAGPVRHSFPLCSWVLPPKQHPLPGVLRLRRSWACVLHIHKDLPEPSHPPQKVLSRTMCQLPQGPCL